jgi:hypothetical protein
MKNLNANQMLGLQGGGEVSNFITGACAGVGVAAWLGMVAISGGGAVVVGVACGVNGLAGAYDWW